MAGTSPQPEQAPEPRLAAEEPPLSRALGAESAEPPRTLRWRIFGAIRTLAAVIPLTLLIWIYAEREQIGPAKPVPIRISLQPSAPDTLVRRTDIAERTITVEVQGPQAGLERMRERLLQSGEEAAVPIAVPADLPEAKVTPLPLLPRLEDAAVFKDNGVAVLRCSPAYVDVVVDHLVSGVEVRPQLRPAVAQRLDGKVTFDPPVIRLRGPRSALSDASAITIYADLREADIPRTAGPREVPSVPVRLAIADPNITLSPSTVTVNITVTQTDAKLTIASVPVFVSGPVTLLDRYRVVFPSGPFISRVTVIGPEEEIEKIRRNDFAPRATLEITSQDLRERLPRSPTFTLPAGVSVSDEDKNRTIDFRLVDRSVPE